jgi:hypothetical protein
VNDRLLASRSVVVETNHAFYVNVLGMKVLRHEEFGSGCEASCNGPYSRPWSKTMIGYARWRCQW